MNMLALLCHTFLAYCDDAYQLIRAILPTRKTFFEHIRALMHYMCFPSWEAMMDFMMRGLEIGPYRVDRVVAVRDSRGALADASLTAPVALNVLEIWSSSSTRSVTTTKFQLPATFRSTFWAKNTMEKLFPLPCVCQNTPARPCPSFRASSIEAMVLFTPRY